MSKKSSSSLWARIAKISIAVLTFLLITYLGICAYAISELTSPEPHNQYDDTPETFGIEYEDVRFPARVDGLKIAGWYLPNSESEKAIIIVHGRHASKQNAISGTVVAFQADLYKAGYSVLAIDLRGHGDSDPARYSFGVYERRDVLGAVDFLLEKGFQEGSIGVVGISLGGAAVNGALAESDAIGAVVTEGTFADFKSIVKEKWQDESGLPNFFLPGVYLMNRIMYGYSLADVNPAAEIAAAAPRPMLIIHCTEDDMVNMTHPQALIQAAPHADSWIMSSCEHAELYRDYPTEYGQRVIDFFDANL